MNHVTTTGASCKTEMTVDVTDYRFELAHDLCVELAKGTNGNVPIQSVYEAMLKLIGREDVIEQMQADGNYRSDWEQLEDENDR